MTSWKKYVLVAVIVMVAGFAYVSNSRRNIPPDLRDAVADDVKAQKFDTSIPVVGKDRENIPVSEAVAPVKTHDSGKGYVEANAAGTPSTPIEWIPIEGGKFMMGTDTQGPHFLDARPVHEVAIKTFDMSKTAVTVEQYAECMFKGGCTEPTTDVNCNWGKRGRQLHPINCVTLDQANQYARFKGARLPSESEWEYAATSGGRNQKYPWGNDEPTCDKAVRRDCNDKFGSKPVCSKPAGNTAQGLCDMAGNVWQWVQDKYQDSYHGVPADGNAFEGETFSGDQVIRGGCYRTDSILFMRADYRNHFDRDFHSDIIGFRLARSR